MSNLILALPGAERLGETLSQHLGWPAHPVEVHRYPDGETGVRLPTAVAGHRVLLAAHLDHPDERTLALVFAADAARELGAQGVGLVAPYLPYMRQDERFRAGEAISSRSYARLLSATVDFLVTVDPHLHRWPSLDAIYGIRTLVVAAAPAIAGFLRREIPQPLLVGPDSESAQWVADVARRLDAPFAVLSKVRQGDRRVQVRLPPGFAHGGRTPVLLDDILSTGHTLAQAAHALRGAGCPPPACVAVHALADDAGMELLHRAGIARIASCDSVPHRTNAIALGELLADGVRSMVGSA